MASQACAAFATLATKAFVPGEFRGAVPAVLSARRARGRARFDVAAKESALAALVALLACVEGAAEDAVAILARSASSVLAAAAATPTGSTATPWRRSASWSPSRRRRPPSSRTTPRSTPSSRSSPSARSPGRVARPDDAVADALAESALDLLCGFASKRSDEGAARRRGHPRERGTVLSRGARAARERRSRRARADRSGDDHREEAQREELVAVEGAAAATARHARRRTPTSPESPRRLSGARKKRLSNLAEAAAALGSSVVRDGGGRRCDEHRDGGGLAEYVEGGAPELSCDPRLTTRYISKVCSASLSRTASRRRSAPPLYGSPAYSRRRRRRQRVGRSEPRRVARLERRVVSSRTRRPRRAGARVVRRGARRARRSARDGETSLSAGLFRPRALHSPDQRPRRRFAPRASRMGRSRARDAALPPGFQLGRRASRCRGTAVNGARND